MPRPRVHDGQRQRVAEGECNCIDEGEAFNHSLTCMSCSKQPACSAATAKRNAVEQHPARSACGEDSPKSVESPTYHAAPDQRFSSGLLEPIDSLDLRHFHKLQPLARKMQSVFHCRVLLMWWGMGQTLVGEAHLGLLERYHVLRPMTAMWA